MNKEIIENQGNKDINQIYKFHKKDSKQSKNPVIRYGRITKF